MRAASMPHSTALASSSNSSRAAQHRQRLQCCAVPQSRAIRPCMQKHLQLQQPCSAVQQHSSTLSSRRQRQQHLVTAAIAGPRSATAPPPEAPSASTSAAAAAVAASGAGAAAAAAVADPCLDLYGVQDRAVGALVGSMCGNALGAQVEPEKHYRLARLFPEGLQDMSWSFDVGPNPLPTGHVTGDFVTMLAVAWSLVRQQQADAFDMLDCLASSYSPGSAARYSPYNALALEGLSEGTNPFLLAKHAEQYLAVTPSRASQSCSHRPDRQLHGTEDFSGVIRAIPVGVAYRDASADVLREAADAAVVFTHPTERGSEGAVAIAAAVAWLIKADPATATPQQLLEHLLTVSSSSPDMTAKLQLLQQRLPLMVDLGLVTDWRAFWGSAHWSNFTATANLLWKQNLAMQGTQAASLALWVVLISWQHPKQAVMLAASLGGYAATTGSLAGALAGALHGCSWVPQAWWSVLQEEQLQTKHMQQQAEEEGEELQLQGEEAAAMGAAVEVEQQQVVLAGQQSVGVGFEEAEDEDSLSTLRVGKYAVVVLGNELAGVSAQQVPRILG